MRPGDDAGYKGALADLFSQTSDSHDTAGTPLFSDLGARLIDGLELHPGDRVLDVGAGTGATLFPAAQAVAETGRVIGIDIAPGMIERLVDSIVRRSFTNVEAMVADGDDLPFADRSFDVVVCAFTLFFFPEPVKALGEFARVLRNGGRLAISTFAKRGSDSIDLIWQLVSDHVEGPPTSSGSRFDERPQIESALAATGFEAVVVEESPYQLAFSGFDEWWSWLRSMEFREYVDRMDGETRQLFRRNAERRLAVERHLPQIRFPMDAYLSYARRP